ncbi:MAG: ribosome biogenesis GTP-binding protein YihA/YsxC [Sulfurimonas sp.]|uniref:ribosome biogenesis GTP-binding protein YihA/YsxC n=1 Tax=Sulfurimonas sp. TaxID=2022749 RepID=UPI002601B77F|nr:ribosome biogenesis GTP-binding protein YihA/YsxC [Sulfurimonas sp.]MDD2652610.1 ribosome biogenesis GTP-binding protein YihA/YsxC [Sulfurimonas sp.]MDD3450752.1 ribosome biogenesis GTP-binding protein YihA/YsxC [Sulfurimonas sp.]
MIEIVDAKFLISAANVAGAPNSQEQNEVVFMARSNVGKSSLLNALTNHKGLAKVSSTPGKTRLINYFDVTFIDRENTKKRFAKFVDLPGFGYAKVAKSLQYDWEKNLTDYIVSREQIKIFVHLVDARHPFLEIDKSVGDFLLQHAQPSQHIVQIFTKIDKLNQKEQNELKKAFPDALMVSSSKKRGIGKIVTLLHSILEEPCDEH